MQLDNLVDSLRNQMFVCQKKENSDKLTKQFYFVRQSDHQFKPQASNPISTPKNLNMTANISKWDDESSRHEVRGIHELQKRLEFLKLNRMELEERSKIKSEYSQTSKNKSRGMFDFKGKMYADKNSRVLY